MRVVRISKRSHPIVVQCSVTSYFRLTSFILRTLHAAHASEWEPLLYMETETLNKIALWVTSQFKTIGKMEGRFEETSDIIYDRYMLVCDVTCVYS